MTGIDIILFLISLGVAAATVYLSNFTIVDGLFEEQAIKANHRR